MKLDPYMSWMEAWLDEEDKYPDNGDVRGAINKHYAGGVAAFGGGGGWWCKSRV